MKKNSIHILIVTSVALCAGATLPFLFGHSTIDPEQQSVKSEVPYCVTSPSVPDKITFAGQEIDLTRYDHRERMDREQMSCKRRLLQRKWWCDLPKSECTDRTL